MQSIISWHRSTLPWSSPRDWIPVVGSPCPSGCAPLFPAAGSAATLARHRRAKTAQRMYRPLRRCDDVIRKPGGRPRARSAGCLNEGEIGRNRREALPVILVTGATGRVGYPLLEALADTGAEFTAMVRVEPRAPICRARQYIVASFDDPPPAEVLRSSTGFPAQPGPRGTGRAGDQFIDAVLTAGHRPHIVKMATDGFQDPGSRSVSRAATGRSPCIWRRPAAGQLPRAGIYMEDPAGRGGADPPGGPDLRALRARPRRVRGGQ